MNDESEKLLAGLVDATLSEDEASRLLERLEADESFLQEAAQHWQVDRLLEATGRGAAESADALARSVRMAIEDSPADARDIARWVGSRLRTRVGGETHRSLTPRALHRIEPVAARRVRPWLLWGSLAAGVALVLALALVIRPQTPRPADARLTPTEARTENPVARTPRVEPPRPIPPSEAPVPTPRTSEPLAPKDEGPSPRPQLPKTPTSEPLDPAPGRPPIASAPRPEPLEPVPGVPPPSSPPREAVEVASLEKMSGEVLIVDGPRRAPARIGAALVDRQGLATAGRESGATLKLADGARLELGTETAVLEIDGARRRIFLAQGTLAAEVPRQPADRPLVFATPQAEAKVLGTRLVLVVKPDSTELEVREGRVRLTRTPDGASVDVVVGYRALAAKTGKLTSVRSGDGARPMPLALVQSWMMQTQKMDAPNAVDLLAASPYDLLVVEPMGTLRDGQDFDMKGMVARLHAGKRGRIVLAWLQGGLAESDRAYWRKDWKPPKKSAARGSPEFLLASEAVDWEDAWAVAYWDPRWQEVVASDVRRLIAAGFDGVYVAGIERYEDKDVAQEARRQGLNPSKTMVDFVAAIQRAVRSASPSALLVAEDAPLLGDADPRYMGAIDAAAFEATWFRGAGGGTWDDPVGGDIPNRATDEDSPEARIRQYAKFLRAGKPVLTRDYCLEPANAAKVYELSRSRGFVPLVTRASCERVTETPPPWLKTGIRR